MNKNFLKKENQQKGIRQKGIAIFIAVVVVSSLMLIALAISDLSYKEQLISTSARDSRIAFYAADSGAECALFHDLKGGANSTFFFPIDMSSFPDQFTCGGAETNPTTQDNSSGSVTTTFHFDLSGDVESCAIVHVTKESDGNGGIATHIESRGYNNTCTVSAGGTPGVADGARNLERSIKIDY